MLKKNLSAGGALAVVALVSGSAWAVDPTINSFTIGTIAHYDETYGFNGGMVLFGTPQVYSVSDGSFWNTGAGSSAYFGAMVDQVTVADGLITYHFPVPVGTPVLYFTDYDSGSHSASGSFVTVAPINVVAPVGSRYATLSGYLKLTANDVSNYQPPRFQFFNAPVGDWVPFSITYNLADSAAWTPETFNGTPKYNFNGTVDLAAHVVPEPSLLGLFSFLPFRRRRPRAAGK